MTCKRWNRIVLHPLLLQSPSLWKGHCKPCTPSRHSFRLTVGVYFLPHERRIRIYGIYCTCSVKQGCSTHQVMSSSCFILKHQSSTECLSHLSVTDYPWYHLYAVPVYHFFAPVSCLWNWLGFVSLIILDTLVFPWICVKWIMYKIPAETWSSVLFVLFHQHFALLGGLVLVWFVFWF